MDYSKTPMDQLAFEQIDLAKKHIENPSRAQAHATLAQAFATLALTYRTGNALQSLREELAQ